MEGIVVLGNQLFPVEFYQKIQAPVFMSEDKGLATHFRYHKIKICFFFLAMRSFAQELQNAGIRVDYHQLSDKGFFGYLKQWIEQNSISKIHSYEIEDHFFRKEIEDFCKKMKIELRIHPSPMFLCTQQEFNDYLASVKKPFMKTFYEQKRKDWGILVDANNRPEGGRWSYDEENRQKIPKGLALPGDIKPMKRTPEIEEVSKVVNLAFADHPGNLDHYWIPYTRVQAKAWLSEFLEWRYSGFGPYEDALCPRGDMLFHSALAPLINIGLLLPHEVIDAAEKAYRHGKTQLASHEGFIRQIMGWREFVRGIYNNFDSIQQRENFFNAQGKLSQTWYTGETNIPLLDFTIRKVMKFSWCHHIERLMVLGNMMLLSGVHPQEVYRWFMEMFSDSSDWVMGPNVFGMSQFSDGGIFATKPYICGSNYWHKMGWPKHDSDEVVDALYWNFISRHQDFFAKQYRMAFAIKTLKRFSNEKRRSIERLATNFIAANTN